MWQSRVEIEHYFVAYFDHNVAFKVLQRRTSVKGGAYMRYVDVMSLHSMYEPHP